MMKKRLKEIMSSLDIGHDFCTLLEEEGIIEIERDEAGEQIISPWNMERIRVARNLFHDMGVNIDGIGIILEMREKMLAFHRVMERVFASLEDELSLYLERVLEEEGVNLKRGEEGEIISVEIRGKDRNDNIPDKGG